MLIACCGVSKNKKLPGRHSVYAAKSSKMDEIGEDW